MSQCMVSTVIESSFQDIQKQGATGEYIISENIGENEPNFEKPARWYKDIRLLS